MRQPVRWPGGLRLVVAPQQQASMRATPVTRPIHDPLFDMQSMPAQKLATHYRDLFESEERSMRIRLTAIAAGLAACTIAAAASAQNAADVVQRDVNQQNRIEQGLKSGELTTKEAGKLEREESHIAKMESNELKDGRMTDAENPRIERPQNKATRHKSRDTTTAQACNPNS